MPKPIVLAMSAAVVLFFVASVEFVAFIASGLAGGYQDTPGIVSAASGIATVAMLYLGAFLGYRETRERGGDARVIRRYLWASLVELLALGISVGTVETGLSGTAGALVADLMALLFLAGLIACNVTVVRTLRRRMPPRGFAESRF